MPVSGPQQLLRRIQRGGDHAVHVVVLVFAQPSPEGDLRLAFGQPAVRLVELPVLFVVDGIVRLVARLPFGAVFPADDRLRQVVPFLVLAELEPLVLDDARVRRLPVRVVDRGVALEVRHVQQLRLEPDGPVLQRAQPVTEVGVDRAREDHVPAERVQLRLVRQVIRVQPHRYALQHALHHARVPARGDALMQRIKVVIVKGEAHRQPPDDERRQLAAGPAPLLLGVALHELFVDVRPHQADGLLLQVARTRDARRPALLFDLRGRFLGRAHAPHAVEGVHVEGQGIELALVVGHRGIGEAIEAGKARHVIPHPLLVGVEDVRAVAVDVNAFDAAGIDVSGDMLTLVHHEDGLPRLMQPLRGRRAEKPRAHDEIVIAHKDPLPVKSVLYP